MQPYCFLLCGSIIGSTNQKRVGGLVQLLSSAYLDKLTHPISLSRNQIAKEWRGKLQCQLRVVGWLELFATEFVAPPPLRQSNSNLKNYRDITERPPEKE